MTPTRERLQHAMHAWADIRSAAHADALNALIERTCGELEMLRKTSDAQAAELFDARGRLAEMQRAMSITAPDAVVDALADLCSAYRSLTGIDGAWDQVAMRAEQAVIAARQIKRSEVSA